MKITKAIMGERLFEWVMKHTFYGHFVAGENRHTIVPTLERCANANNKTNRLTPTIYDFGCFRLCMMPVFSGCLVDAFLFGLLFGISVDLAAVVV